MVIFTGTGRCGTQTAAEVFCIPHEWRRRQPDALLGTFTHQGAEKGCPYPALKDRVARVRKHLAHFDGHISAFAESSGAWLPFLDAAYQVDPDCRIVLLVRDVFQFCRSFVSRGAHKRSDWTVKPAPGDKYARDWDGWNPMQKAAFCWMHRNRMALRLLEDVPATNWTICTTAAIYPQIRRLEGFTGLHADPDKVKARHVYNRSGDGSNPGYVVGPPDTWDAKVRAQVVEIAEPLMRRLFDYGERL